MPDGPLVGLLRALDAQGYDFVTPSPATHRRYLAAREDRAARSIRDVFGWSLPFDAEVLPPELFDLLKDADGVVADEDTGGLRARFRVARVGKHLFLHSAYPTHSRDAVFFGPDTYRFLRFVEGACHAGATRLVDLGAGSGAGAIHAAALLPHARLTLVDMNPEALRLARANAAAAGVEVEIVEGNCLDAVGGDIDLIIANPPFIADASGRLYCDGGGLKGAQVSLDWALAAAARLGPEGRAVLYTGSAICDGRDALHGALAERLPPLGCALTYREIDPDIFGELLSTPAYKGVERIAAIGAIIQRLPSSAR